MKKSTILFLFLCTFFVVNVFGQARQELNFGLIGANYEIPVQKNITIAPGASTNFDLNWLTLSVRGNYYFDNLFEITNESWDVYGGLAAGYSFYNGDGNNDSDFDLGLHVGGRWFWNEKWGALFRTWWRKCTRYERWYWIDSKTVIFLVSTMTLLIKGIISKKISCLSINEYVANFFYFLKQELCFLCIPQFSHLFWSFKSITKK